MDSQQKLGALHVSRAFDQGLRTFSVRSFYATDGSDSDDSVVSTMSRAMSLADYPMDKKGKPRASEGDPGKTFRKKVKRIAKNERKNLGSGSEEEYEPSRGAPSVRVVKGELSKLVENVLDDSADNGVTVAAKQRELKAARMALFAARTAIDVQPELLKKTKQNMAVAERKMMSPSTRPMNATAILERNRVEDERRNALSAGFPVPVSEEEMRKMLVDCRSNTQMMQHLLYSKKFDSLWKPSHLDILVADKKERKPDNRQGWVLPLKKICEKAGLGTRFFTDNRAVSLNDARSQVLKQRLTSPMLCGDWLHAFNARSVKNPHLITYMKTLFEPRVMQSRLAFYLEHVQADRDRVRVSGKYYNNIHLDLFGPSKKQKVETSIVGGMERRFEILENQVNHIPFTHDMSDQHQDKCRNPRVHCRDSTRVVLSYPSPADDSSADHDFIHANWVRGGPLFSEFIVTQAPMDETIGDFWRMVWQEKVPYIFMLISRKDPERCASYWPRRLNSPSFNYHGLRIENHGVDETRDPLFRITSIRIIGPDNSEHHVEHWQADMNNSSNLYTPLNLLRLARNCTNPVVVHDCLGISRASCLVAIEVAICSMIKGPTYKHLVQKTIQFVRSCRPFSVETPMQFVYVHRCLMQFFKPIAGPARGFEEDYRKWLSARGLRMFVDPLDSQIPGYRMLSPKCDPDLLRLVGRPARPNYRREAPDCVGEWPLPLEENTITAPAARRRIDV